MRSGFAVVFMGLALCLAPAARAQPRTPPQPEYAPDDFIKAMTSAARCESAQPTDGAPVGQCRSFSLLVLTPHHPAPHPPAGPAHAFRPPPAMVPASFAADVRVEFAAGSARITPQGLANLRSLAAALNSNTLDRARFEVGGYTDASGDPRDNFFLSQTRADAVKAELVRLGVEADRLVANGYGADDLAYPDQPTSPANRRVEVRRLPDEQ